MSDYKLTGKSAPPSPRPEEKAAPGMGSRSHDLTGADTNSPEKKYTVPRKERCVKMKTTVCVRMSSQDKAKVETAAKRERVSMSAFLLRAGLAVASNGRARPVDVLPDEAQVAIAALVGAEFTQSEATSRVRQALAENPNATADELVAAAFVGKG